MLVALRAPLETCSAAQEIARQVRLETFFVRRLKTVAQPLQKQEMFFAGSASVLLAVQEMSSVPTYQAQEPQLLEPEMYSVRAEAARQPIYSASSAYTLIKLGAN
jgi:hypothetical protein